MQSIRKKSFAAEQLAKRQKKNPTTIAIIVLAVIIAVGAVGYALYVRFGEKEIPVNETTAPGKEEIKSIAVLPFENVSADEEQEYFCDGMAEEIINALSHVEGLRVIARTSTFFFKGKDYKVKDVGKELNVETVLEGSVRKVDNQLRITAQLINVADESHIWSDAYNRELVDVFAIQEEISLAIVEALKVKLLKGEKAAIEKRYTYNIEAYDRYLIGLHYFDRTEFKMALNYYNQAIALDPNFAKAYAAIADVHWLSFGRSHPEETLSKARAAVEKALSIDDKLAAAYVSLALLNMYYEWDWSAAESNLKIAAKLNPNSSWMHHGWIDYYMILGQFDKMFERTKKVLDLDPMRLEYLLHLGCYYAWVGRYGEAMEVVKKMDELDPINYSWTGNVLINVYGYQSKYKEYLNYIQKKFKRVIGDGYFYGMSGEKAKAEQILLTLIERKKTEYVSSENIARIYIGLGEYDKAFEWLNRAYEERDPFLVIINSFWRVYYTSVLSDPRFKALLKKMGLPED